MDAVQKTKTIDKVHFWKHIFREFDDITGTISIIHMTINLPNFIQKDVLLLMPNVLV